MARIVDMYDGWGNYVGSAKVTTHEEQAGGCIGMIIGFVLFLFLKLLVLGVIGALPLWQRVFINPDVVVIHMKRAARVFGAALIVVLTYFVLQELNIVETSDSDQWFNVALVIAGFGGATMLNGIIQIVAAQIYPDKARGNGYGIMNVIALLPGIRPTHLLTVLQDGAFVALAVASVVMQPGDIEAKMSTGVAAVVTIGAWLGLGYTWYCDSEFGKAQDQVDAENARAYHEQMAAA